MSLLLVEDDTRLAETLKKGLEAEQYRVSLAKTGEEAFFLLNSETFDLVLLDWMLPGKSGIEILRVVREKGIRIPVIVLTARDGIEDRVEGLDAGADDYLVKPVAFAELVARVRAQLRRGRTENTLHLKLSDLEMDLVTRKVSRQSKPIDLTVREYELLEYLLRHAGQIVSREMLARDVWKEVTRATPLDNVIDVHIMRLRKKIDSESDTKLLQTIRGVGFSLKEGH